MEKTTKKPLYEGCPYIPGGHRYIKGTADVKEFYYKEVDMYGQVVKIKVYPNEEKKSDD